MKRILLCALVLSACSGSATAPVDNDAPTPTAGTGIKVDSATGAISVDTAVVPTVPSCAAGEMLMRTGAGWACAAAAPDATMLGGKLAATYLTADGTVANATNLGGHPVSFYLPATAKAADSAMLNGHLDTDFLAATGTAANAAQLGGQPASAYLGASGTAANSAQLGGQPASAYLSTSGTAANASKLGGQLPSGFLGAWATAVNSSKLNGFSDTDFLKVAAQAQSAVTADKLGGVAASSYLRNDTANQVVPATVTIGAPAGTRLVLGANATDDIFGSNSFFGNLHLDADTAGADGRIYLNWYSGKGVAFADGANHEVASFDKAGNLKAASFNAMQIFSVANGSVTAGGCESLCNNNSQAGTCISAKFSSSAGAVATTQTSCATSVPWPSTWSFSCMCSSF